MNRLAWLLGGLLVASLLVNLELWHRRHETGGASTSQPRPAATRAAHPSGSAASVAGVPRPVRPAPGAGTSLRDQSCPDQLRGLGQRLADAEQQLDRYLPPDKRFEKGAPSPALESKMQRALVQILDGAPDGWSHNLECRADVCRLDMIARDGSEDFDWMHKLQSQRPDGVVGMMFGASRPGQDPVTKEPLTSESAYLRVRSGAASGQAILSDVIARLDGGGAAARCGAAHPDATGYWSIRLDLSPEARHITVSEGGTLAATPAGSCLRAALDQIIDATDVPDAFIGAAAFHTVSLPVASPRRISSRPAPHVTLTNDVRPRM